MLTQWVVNELLFAIEMMKKKFSLVLQKWCNLTGDALGDRST